MKALILATLLVTGSAAVGVPATAQTPAPPSAPFCAGVVYHQFDFWVGRWDVYVTGGDVLVAHSLVEALYDGCAVRENWMPLKGPAGGSLSGFSGLQGGWRQTWIGGGGGWGDFRGGLEGGAMVLTGEWGSGVSGLTRMTYTPGADGSVRQSGETSSYGGKTWAPSFDFTYRRAR